VALPDHAPAVELVIEQPHYGQPSVISPLYIAWPTTGDHQRSRACRPVRQPSCTGASNNSQSAP